MNIIKIIFFSLFFSLLISTHADAAEDSYTKWWYTKQFRRYSATSPDFPWLTKKEYQRKLNNDLLIGAWTLNPEMVSKALNAGAEVNCRDFMRNSALHRALKSWVLGAPEQKKEIIQQLLSHKAHINAQGEGKLTPLALSVCGYHARDVTEIILKAKADIEIDIERRGTAIEIASCQSCPDDRIKQLIEWGAQPKTIYTNRIYAEHVKKYEENPPAEVVQYKKEFAQSLNPFIPVTALADLVMQYVPNLDIKIMLNRTHTEKTEIAHAK